MTERRDTAAGSSPNAMGITIGHSWRDGLRLCFCAVIFAYSLIGCVGKEQVYEPEMSGTYDRWAGEAERFAYVDELGVGPVLGRLLLVRGGTELCAVRFSEWHRGRNAGSFWFFWSGDEDTSAEYEWFYQGDGTSDLTKPNVQSGRGKAYFRGIAGMGHYAAQFASPYVDCGQFRLPWVYPNQVNFTHTNWTGPRDPVELAPTGWQQLSEIDLASAKLRWYGFDLQRHERRGIPIDELR